MRVLYKFLIVKGNIYWVETVLMGIMILTLGFLVEDSGAYIMAGMLLIVWFNLLLASYSWDYVDSEEEVDERETC